MQLETIDTDTGAAPRHCVVWLHGLGADGHDFAPLVPQLVVPAWPPIRFVFPHAPVRGVTINNGARMRAWYDILAFDLAHRADEDGVAESVTQVEALIDAQVARGIPTERIFLAGFSQGGAIALAVALRRGAPLAGIIALSTYLPTPHKAAAALVDGANAQPVFMAHGSQDPVVPFSAGQASAAALRTLGFSVDWHAYPMPHSVCGEEVDDLRAWLAPKLQG